jgi:hypothetical protein
MKTCLGLLLAILFLPTPPVGPASSMEKKLQHVEANGALAHPDSTPTDLSEEEINAYFASGKIKLPDGVQSVRFTGLDGAIGAVARVDFDKIRASRRSSNPFLSVFSGVNDVQVQAHAHGAGGKGIVHVDSVSLNDVEIPRFVLELFVEKYLQPKHPEIGVDSRFDLPDKIDSATIRKHSLRLIQK